VAAARTETGGVLVASVAKYINPIHKAKLRSFAQTRDPKVLTGIAWPTGRFYVAFGVAVFAQGTTLRAWPKAMNITELEQAVSQAPTPVHNATPEQARSQPADADQPRSVAALAAHLEMPPYKVYKMVKDLPESTYSRDESGRIVLHPIAVEMLTEMARKEQHAAEGS
jgi:hypothetical protein